MGLASSRLCGLFGAGSARLAAQRSRMLVWKRSTRGETR
jgi:hypothetical protein